MFECLLRKTILVIDSISCYDKSLAYCLVTIMWYGLTDLQQDAVATLVQGGGGCQGSRDRTRLSAWRELGVDPPADLHEQNCSSTLWRNIGSTVTTVMRTRDVIRALLLLVRTHCMYQRQPTMCQPTVCRFPQHTGKPDFTSRGRTHQFVCLHAHTKTGYAENQFMRETTIYMQV